MIQLPPHNHPKDERELKRQLDIEDRFPLALLIALLCAVFVFAIAAAIIAGLSFEHWRTIVGL